MRFSTEIRSGEFPAIFGRFEALFGSPLWRRRAGKIRDDLRGNPYLRQWLLEENRIAFVLDAYSMIKHDHGMLPQIQSKTRVSMRVLRSSLRRWPSWIRWTRRSPIAQLMRHKRQVG